MEWSVGHSTPAGKRGKTEIPQRSEEAQVPPRGKRVTVAQWNERVETNQRDGNSECSSFRSNHFVMSQTLVVYNKLFKENIHHLSPSYSSLLNYILVKYYYLSLNSYC
ncbi:hypothetical protein MHL30_10475 [Priestia flexa]|uniref:hypothetical protein n=1 Tax=Priestia flexa TaxID=86664 RepID=UPI001EF63C43|nr:hypothetical protein [Priestia flexa]MCG7313607.1 hypothetical protein [Priestia flexa]